MSAIDAVIAKVRKLRNLATSANVHEAATAAALADKLIQEHGLAEAQLEADGQEPGEKAEEATDPTISWHGQVPAWQSCLASFLARHYDCAPYRTHGRDSYGKRYEAQRVVGRPSDVATLRYMLAWLVAEIERLAQLEPKGMGRSYYNAYRMGAVAGVRSSMTAAKDAARTQATSAALVVFDNRQALAEAALKATHDDLKAGRSRGTVGDVMGFNRGQAAGKQIHTGKVVGDGGGQRALPGKGG
jgi:hypothetical protein